MTIKNLPSTRTILVTNFKGPEDVKRFIELLPVDDSGNISQITEKTVGPYILHDFFLYHFLRYGASIKKIYMIACLAFI